MMRSMYSGVSGIGVHQTKMDVIGNNIANVNTTGFKSQRTTFAEAYSQTLQMATGANGETGLGGKNPSQVGLGVALSSVDTLMTPGAAQRTDNPFDLMIAGDGFLIVSDATGTYFTRAGALRQDAAGNLCTPSGRLVMGWPPNDDKNGVLQGEVQEIVIGGPTTATAPPATTTLSNMIGNLDPAASPIVVTQKLFDSLGNAYTVALTLTIGQTDTATNLTPWTITMPTEGDKDDDVLPADIADLVKLTDSNNQEIFVPPFLDNEDGDIVFNFRQNGELYLGVDGDLPTTFNLLGLNLNGAVRVDPFNETQLDPNYLGVNSYIGFPAPTGDTPIGQGVEINMAGVTQFQSKSTAETTALNGRPSGNIIGYEIAGDGTVSGTYDNGMRLVLGQVVVAVFENPTGLERLGDNMFKVTNNSGEFDSIGSVGEFASGMLEMSNVDLSREFTEMIVTQRGYQANSRTITVSDELLQELVNLV